MNQLMTIIKNYWISEDTNIFNNYKDALFGFVVLVVIPGLSLSLTVHTDEYTFWNYTFPFLSISLAGLYDTYGRYNGISPKNTKLLVRALLDLIALFFSCLCIGVKSVFLPYVAPILLTICGLMLIYEIYLRVKNAILISSWIA